MAKLANLKRVFEHQLKDIYNAEKQLIKALPDMAEGASNQELKEAIENHLEETKGQVKRLEEVFALIEMKPSGHTCKAMQGLIEEGKEILDESAEPEARDAAIICAAQKVEHYEIATYGTLRSFAETLGLNEAASLLTQTLEEEGKADKLLTQLAEQTINMSAMQ
jgi:ferritin-like metal-binding protein YciE